MEIHGVSEWVNMVQCQMCPLADGLCCLNGKCPAHEFLIVFHVISKVFIVYPSERAAVCDYNDLNNMRWPIAPAGAPIAPLMRLDWTKEHVEFVLALLQKNLFWAAKDSKKYSLFERSV